MLDENSILWTLSLSPQAELAIPTNVQDHPVETLLDKGLIWEQPRHSRDTIRVFRITEAGSEAARKLLD